MEHQTPSVFPGNFRKRKVLGTLCFPFCLPENLVQANLSWRAAQRALTSEGSPLSARDRGERREPRAEAGAPSPPRTALTREGGEGAEAASMTKALLYASSARHHTRLLLLQARPQRPRRALRVRQLRAASGAADPST